MPGRHPVITFQINLHSFLLKLLANENFPLASVRILREKGYDVCAIGTDYSGVKDEMVMQIAMKVERLILTFDRDYGEADF